MTVTGIIAEFNPFHNGHKYLIENVKKQNQAVVCILSGDFVQRGEPSVYDKRVRSAAALLNGADLVIELPAMWSMSGAEKFAYSAVKMLFDTKTVNGLSFGINTDNVEILKSIAKYINSDEYALAVKTQLPNSDSYADAREKAVCKKFGIDNGLLKDGNNILAVEYLKAVDRLNFNADIFTVKRNGAAHNCNLPVENFASSTYLRELIKTEGLENIRKFVPPNTFELYCKSEHTDIGNIANSIIFRLRQLTEADYKLLPDISEGIENRLRKSVNSATSYLELLELMQTKRYPTARIRRLILNAALSVSNQYSRLDVPYFRVLGFNKTGEEVIKAISKNSSLPIIINSNQALSLKGFEKEAFKKQCEINDIYQLCFNRPNSCSKEITYQPLKY